MLVEKSNIILTIHQLFPSLSRSVRSRVEEYRSITQQLLLSYSSAVPENKNAFYAVCELMGLLASFPPYGISPPLSREQLLSMIHSVLEKQHECESMKHLYHCWIALNGVSHYCQQCYYSVSVKEQGQQLQISVVDALNRVDSGVTICVVVNGEEEALALRNGFYWYACEELPSSILIRVSRRGRTEL